MEADALHIVAGSKKQSIIQDRPYMRWNAVYWKGETVEIPPGSESVASLAQDTLHTWEICGVPETVSQPQAVKRQGLATAAQKSDSLIVVMMRVMTAERRGLRRVGYQRETFGTHEV